MCRVTGVFGYGMTVIFGVSRFRRSLSRRRVGRARTWVLQVASCFFAGVSARSRTCIYRNWRCVVFLFSHIDHQTQYTTVLGACALCWGHTRGWWPQQSQRPHPARAAPAYHSRRREPWGSTVASLAHPTYTLLTPPHGSPSRPRPPCLPPTIRTHGAAPSDALCSSTCACTARSRALKTSRATACSSGEQLGDPAARARAFSASRARHTVGEREQEISASRARVRRSRRLVDHLAHPADVVERCLAPTAAVQPPASGGRMSGSSR